MLQEYLNNQFIQTSDDANFEKLKKTCSEISKRISKDKVKILTYSLIAFDPDIAPNNPEIIIIQNQIVENWQTFIPNSKDTAITIIRSIILEVLHDISKDINTACIIWFAARNVFKYYKLGREEYILTAFLTGLGNKIEVKASDSWRFSPDVKIEIPKVTAFSIDESDLNPLTSTTVKEGVGKVIKKLTSDLKDNQTQFANQIVLMQMRTQLLWWKEAGYSKSKKEIYQKMAVGELVLLLAFDYCDFIPDLYPVSVDYFLIATLKSIFPPSENKITISDFLIKVKESSADLQFIIPNYNSGFGRISFMNFLSGLIHQEYQVKEFQSLVGISEEVEFKLYELTLWIFHDLHSIKLSQSK